VISRALAATGLLPALLLAAPSAAGSAATAGAAPTPGAFATASAELPPQEVWAELTFRDWPGRWVAGTITDGVSKSSSGGPVTVTSATPSLCEVQQGSGHAFTVRFLDGGTCLVHAEADGDASWAPSSNEWHLDAESKQISRLSGPDRVATSIASSRFLHPSTRQAAGALIATTTGFADALAAAGPSVVREWPLLLNPSDHLDPRIAGELTRLLPPGSQVTLVGGRSALGDAVEAAVRALPGGYDVRRVAGDDRYATAAALIAENGPPTVGLPYSGPLYLVSGTDWPDGLSVAPLATQTWGAVLLTGPGATLPAATRVGVDAAVAAGREVVAVGGPAARSWPQATRTIVGTDRYDTSRLVSDRLVVAGQRGTPRRVVFASGTSWPDALVGATVAGQESAVDDTQGPLLLTAPDGLREATRAALRTLDPDRIYEVRLSGGTSALTPALEAQVRAAFVVRPEGTPPPAQAAG